MNGFKAEECNQLLVKFNSSPMDVDLPHLVESSDLQQRNCHQNHQGNGDDDDLDEVVPDSGFQAALVDKVW